MKRIAAVLTFIIIAITIKGQEVYHKKLLLMGSRFDLYVEAIDSTHAADYFRMAIAEIQRIENLISSWDS